MPDQGLTKPFLMPHAFSVVLCYDKMSVSEESMLHVRRTVNDDHESRIHDLMIAQEKQGDAKRHLFFLLHERASRLRGRQ